VIEVKKFVFNYFGENTYLVFDNESKEAMIIDPGCFAPSEKKSLEEFIVKRELNLKYMINTHCHIDHVLGNKFVKERFNPEYFAPELDMKLLSILPEQASMFNMSIELSPKPDSYLTEELELNIGASKVTFLFTPGHTAGEYCVLIKDQNRCFTGDVLFKESIGRTDLWDGDQQTLFNSIKNKLLTLNEDTIVHPGHGENTTIGYEKAQNPFLYDFI